MQLEIINTILLQEEEDHEISLEHTANISLTTSTQPKAYMVVYLDSAHQDCGNMANQILSS